jgi:hypothetical protein
MDKEKKKMGKTITIGLQLPPLSIFDKSYPSNALLFTKLKK